MLFVALLTVFLVVSLAPLTYAHDVTLTLNSSPITGVNVWYVTQLGGSTGGPFLTDTAVVVSSSDQGALPFGEGAYKISYELQPEIGGIEYILSHFIVGTETVGYKQDLVHCVLGEVDVGYLRLSLFADTTVEAVYEVKTFGPKIDRVRFKVIKSPDPTLIAMQVCEVDIAPDLIRTGDIEKLYGDGFTITSTAGFHMGHIGLNIRPDQSYKDPAHGSPIAGPVLSDVNFRHALFHCYNQEEIVAAIYKYIVTPVQSLVPPAQGGWVNPNVPTHPYNPGDPTATTMYPADHSACGILRYGGYTYDSGAGNWIVPYDLDDNPDTDDYIPTLKVFTPTYEVAPTSAEHGHRFVEDCNRIGIPLYHDPREFAPYLDLVFGTEAAAGGEFDLYMVFWGLGRFPDHLYDMCISTQDCYEVPGAYNSPGIHSDELDEAVSTIKFSLDHDAKMEAAKKAQMMLYNETYSECAFSYLQLYSRILFNAFKPGMKGIVNSPGYGSDNLWTYRNMHWDYGPDGIPETEDDPNTRIEDGEDVIIYCLGEEPERLNPCFAHTVYAWEIIGTVVDGLMEVNPYTHEDLGWMAWDWEIEKWATEDEVDELLAGAVLGSHWHEAWPFWSTNWNMTSWIDEDVSDTLTVGDQVYFEDGRPTAAPPETEVNASVTNVAWDIKIERKICPYDEKVLHAIAGPVPPDPITDPTVISWHELWPNYCTEWIIHDWVDTDGSGDLTRSDQVLLCDGDWYHVDSVTMTIELDKKPVDGVTDKYLDFAGTGMKLLYWLRDDVYWQCGNQFTAQDAKWNLLFMQNNRIPRYTSTWENIVDVATVGLDEEPHFKLVVYLNKTSQFLIYDIAGITALLPPPVWAHLDGKPLTEILAYDPTANRTKPTDAGPDFGVPPGPMTQLYGTGPFIFDMYDPVGLYGEVHANREFFMPTIKMQAEKAEMFHAIGDADWDGEIGIFDLSRQGRSYGYFGYEPQYDAQADVNQDGIVDMRDITMTAFFWGDKREYPEP